MLTVTALILILFSFNEFMFKWLHVAGGFHIGQYGGDGFFSHLQRPVGPRLFPL